MNINKEIGRLLKEARVKRGLSLRATAERLGKDHSTIHAYETGRQAINVDVLGELCDIYGVTYIDLLSEVYYTMKREEGK